MAEKIKICCIHTEAVAVRPRRGGSVGLHDAMNPVRLHVPAAERVAVLARIAAGQQPVAPVLLEVLVLGEYDDLPGVGIDDPDHFLPGVRAVPLNEVAQQGLGSGDEEESRCPQILVDGRFPDVVHARLDLDREDELVDAFAPGLPFIRALPAVDDGHDDIVFEVVAVVVRACVVRLLDFVVCAGVEHVSLLLPREEKDG